DLGRPLRFWHMIVQSETFRRMLKTSSPMSSGAWALLGFGGCAFLSFVAVLVEGGWFDWPALRRLSAPSPVGRVVTVIGTFLALYVAGYTGVRLAVSNRRVWADATLLGATSLIRAWSTSAPPSILAAGRGGVTG